jgi:dipeptidyl aminopeptidase/acylaminoacyl peptidase
MVRFVRLFAALSAVLLCTTLSAPVASATYPGGDGKIAFVRSNQIYTVNSSGTGVVKLTTTGKNYRPKWSPDGTRIAYINETSTSAKDVWVMKANGSVKQRVTRLGTVNAAASWSPDGQWLAFGAGNLQKIRSTAPFGPPVQLSGHFTGCWDCDGSETGPVPVDRFVAWSPDGTRIAVYNHADAQLDDAIYWYFTGTHEAREVMATGGECCGDADWTDLTWGPRDEFGYAVVDYDYDTYERLPSRIVYPGFSSRDGDKGAAASPSGRSMAFTNDSSGTARIYISAANGTNRRVLTNGYQPDWQPLP